jgi:hypothetical protein
MFFKLLFYKTFYTFLAILNRNPFKNPTFYLNFICKNEISFYSLPDVCIMVLSARCFNW